MQCKHLRNVSLYHHTVFRKKDQNGFLYTFPKTLNDSYEMWYIVFLINLLQNYLNVLHLTLIMSVHCLMKLEVFVTHVLSLSC